MEIERIFGLLFAAILGGILGSFFNVLIIRWHEGKDLGGRSFCPKCKKTIKARHLIPIVSWLWLKGKCADCGKKISSQYVLVEATAAMLGIIAALRWDPFSQPMFWFEFLLSASLLVPVVMDLRWKELPVEYLLGIGIAGMAFNFSGLSKLGNSGLLSLNLLNMAIALAATAVFFGGQHLLSRGRWLGSGDIIFGLMMSGVLSWPLAAVGVYAAYIIGAVAALIGLVSGVFTRKMRLPFAPALAAGTMVAVWFGPGILHWLAYASI